MTPIVFFLGTAAELIKVYPVLRALDNQNRSWKVVSSAQAPYSFGAQWKEFGLREGFESLSPRSTDLLSSGEAFFWFLSSFVSGLFSRACRENFEGHTVVVHGDTLTTLLGAILARWHKAARLVHLEGGRRSGNLWRPFPEEISRRLVSRLTQLHLSENAKCAENLRKEGKTNIVDTFGNTQQAAIDLRSDPASKTWEKPYCVLNLHRFENMAFQWENVLRVTKASAQGRTAYFISHGHVEERLGLKKAELEAAGVKFLPRLGFFSFLSLLEGAEFLVTDGSGNQDDVALLGVPTLILREEIETSTALAPAGSGLLAGWRWPEIEKFFAEYKKYRRPPQKADPRILQAAVGALIERGK